jgi:hypothetical protein
VSPHALIRARYGMRDKGIADRAGWADDVLVREGHRGLLAACAVVVALGLVGACTAQAPTAQQAHTRATHRAVGLPSPWWAGFQRPGATQTRVFSGLPGSVAYRCVEVGNYSDVRSGGFVAGNFRFDRENFASVFKPVKEVKIYWIPLHVGTMPTLTVRETHVGFPDTTLTATWRDVAANPGVVFYPSATPIPVSGTWRLMASAGPNRGCFVVTFGR